MLDRIVPTAGVCGLLSGVLTLSVAWGVVMFVCVLVGGLMIVGAENVGREE